MNRKKTMKREYQAYLYILPWILGFAILQLYPFVSSFIYSFTDYTVGAKATFQGLANYKKLFTQDKEFWNSLKVTILFALYTVPGKLIMALAVAMFLNRDLKGINLIRTLYYIPSLFGGSVAVALLWRLMFLDNGVINAILSALHLPVIQWLGDTRYALRTICMLEIWQFGSSMVMFFAAGSTLPLRSSRDRRRRKSNTFLPYYTASDLSDHFLQPDQPDHPGTAELYFRTGHYRRRTVKVHLCTGTETVQRRFLLF